MGIIPRFTKLWRKIYNKRGAIERWYSIGKRSRLLDKHQLLRMGKITLHVNMSMPAWLLTALARLKTDDYRRMRHMYIRLPWERRGDRQRSRWAGTGRIPRMPKLPPVPATRRAGGVGQDKGPQFRPY